MIDEKSRVGGAGGGQFKLRMSIRRMMVRSRRIEVRWRIEVEWRIEVGWRVECESDTGESETRMRTNVLGDGIMESLMRSDADRIGYRLSEIERGDNGSNSGRDEKVIVDTGVYEVEPSGEVEPVEMHVVEKVLRTDRPKWLCQQEHLLIKWGDRGENCIGNSRRFSESKKNRSEWNQSGSRDNSGRDANEQSSSSCQQ